MRRILLPSLFVLSHLLVQSDALSQTAQCQNATLQLDANGDASLPDQLLFLPQVDIDVQPSNGAPEVNNVWQSFTPTVSGILDRITVVMETLNVPVGLNLTIYSGQGTGGTVLHTQSIASLALGANILDIATTLDLVAGNVYTFRVNCSGGTFYPQRNNGNIYAGGLSSIGANFDLVFSTRMLERPSIDNGSTSATGISSFALSRNTFSCTDNGNVPVTLTVTAKNGGTASCVSTVSVEDNIDPTAVCVGGPVTVTLDINGDGLISLGEVDNGSGDNCTFNRSLSQSTFNCGHVGLNTITMTVLDVGLNTATCDVIVEVIDNIPPAVFCQDLTVSLDANGFASVSVGDIDNGSNDACGIAVIELDVTDFDCTDIGANTVTLYVEDGNGNSNTCTATVTVVDDTDPLIFCPSSQTLCATGGTGAVITYSDPVGFDNCSFNIVQTDLSGLVSGSMFPTGTTTIAYTVTDDGGNTASCSFNVKVDAKPVAGFTYIPACASEPLFFTNTSTIESGYSIVSHVWDMGDGSGPITQVNPLFVYTSSGDYNVTLTVTSADGCVDEITQTVTVTATPEADFSAAPVCLGAVTEFTNLTTSDPGYTGNVSYVWNFGDGSPLSTDASPSHIYALSGIFTVTLTATNDEGCSDVIQRLVIVSALPQAQFVSSTACEGTATQFTDLSFGTDLSYAWDFGDGNLATAQNPSNLYAGGGVYTATLTVTAPGGCQSTVSNSVTVFESPEVAFSFANACAGSTIQFTNTSDAGTYTWNFGDNNSSVLTDPANTYPVEGLYDVTLTVLSSQSCFSSLTQTVEVYRNPTFTLQPTSALCFGESSGTLFVNPIPPVANFWEITVNGGAPVTNQFLYTGLPAGNYAVSVLDEFGCVGSGTTIIGQPMAPLSLGTPSLTNLLCNGDNTGSLTIEADGGTSPYTYAINGGAFQSSGTFIGLAANDYFVEAQDVNGCSVSTQLYTITQPAVLVLSLASSSNLLCNGDFSGALSTLTAGGTSPYLYSIDGGSFGTSFSFNGLAAGQHVVIVRDANSCEASVQTTLTEPGILQLSVVNSENILCNGQNTGSVTVAAAAGTAPYQYSKDGVNYQGSGAFTGFGSGTHTFFVTDANGCTAQVSQTLTQPQPISMQTTSVPVFCFGASTGSITAIGAGGTLPYSYSFNGGASFQPGFTATGLASGSYVVVVRDVNGCQVSQGVEITEVAQPLVLTGASTASGCVGAANGSVVLTATGGTPTYTYSANGVVFQNQNQFGGLAAGTYTYMVMDINGCQASVSLTVAEPLSGVQISEVLVNDPACGLSTNGAVTVQASGGTPSYTYSANGSIFQSSPILSGLGVGTYNVMVRDANGCTSTQEVTLQAPPALEITVVNVVGVECAGSFVGSLEVSGSGGIPGYTWSLSGGAQQTLGTFTELTNGVYNVQIEDVNGCTATVPVEVPFEFPVPVAEFTYIISGNAVVFNNLSQFGDSYLWNFGDGNTSIEENPTHFYETLGPYTVTLSVTNGCGTRTRSRSFNNLTLGVDEDVENTFGLYPNPASDELFITTAKDVNGTTVLEVTSIAGKRVMVNTVGGMNANGRVRLDVSGLGQGMYLLSVQSGEGRSVIRFNVTR